MYLGIEEYISIIYISIKEKQWRIWESWGRYTDRAGIKKGKEENYMVALKF